MSGTTVDFVRELKNAERQVQESTEVVNRKICGREEEAKRARAAFKMFQEKRIADDMQNDRICQPPVFYKAWKSVIGKIDHYVKGAENGALKHMFDSYEATIAARNASHQSNISRLLK